MPIGFDLSLYLVTDHRLPIERLVAITRSAVEGGAEVGQEAGVIADRGPPQRRQGLAGGVPGGSEERVAVEHHVVLGTRADDQSVPTGRVQVGGVERVQRHRGQHSDSSSVTTLRRR